jgi:hypothetical protein
MNQYRNHKNLNDPQKFTELVFRVFKQENLLCFFAQREGFPKININRPGVCFSNFGNNFNHSAGNFRLTAKKISIPAESYGKPAGNFSDTAQNFNSSVNNISKSAKLNDNSAKEFFVPAQAYSYSAKNISDTARNINKLHHCRINTFRIFCQPVTDFTYTFKCRKICISREVLISEKIILHILSSHLPDMRETLFDKTGESSCCRQPP